MSDPHASTDMETQSSPGWTFVSSQGEIMSGDEDSESSESSIEVLSFEGSEAVEHLQLIRSHPVEAEVMVTEDAPETDANSEDDILSAETVISETQPDSAYESAEQPVNSIKAVISQDTILETTVERFPDLMQADLILLEGSCSGAGTSTIADEMVQEQLVHLPEVAVLCSSESQHSVTCETAASPSHTEIGEASVEEANVASVDDKVLQVSTEIGEASVEEANVASVDDKVLQVSTEISETSVEEANVAGADDNVLQVSTEISEASVEEANVAGADDNVLQVSTEISEASFEEANVAGADDNVLQDSTESAKEPVIMNATEDIAQSAGNVRGEEPQKKEAGEDIDGACCMELLLEGIESSGNSQSAHSLSDAHEDIQSSPNSFPLSFDEESIAKVSLESTVGSSLSSRNDSDADSDFVRLDSDSMDAFVGENQFNEERIMIPLRLYRSEYTIGPGFNFIRNDGRNDPTSPNENPVDNIEHDRDDDTESSTEEGIDDRIESEQSEAGSLSAQNDIGDLSVFADIGDLPLVAGDVPRNYIHRPNNHLSTVLNIIVVLVAILTMGISLGIIMATDMEIEEWQNAYEFQTRKVSQLEILLKGKTKAHELQLSRVKELEGQVVDLKNIVWTFERRAKNCERGMETLAAYSSLEGGTFGKVMHTILNGMKDYIQCQTESNQLVAVDCHLKLLPYVRNYTALIKNDLLLNEPTNIDLGVPVNTDNQNGGDLGTASQEMNAEVPGLAASSQQEGDSFQAHEEEYLEVETEVPGLAASSQLEGDSLQAHEEEYLELETEDETPDEQSDSEYIFVPLEKESGDDVDSFEVSIALPESSESEKSGIEKSESSEYSDRKAAKETFRASPVPLDIRQLQQSLTLEQERALHWQQLYLSERRQKERERDNEVWEDEREREIAEREREQMDQVECLKKLMSANLTTLTQHVARWNVSVFDDFANLSMLLSGISDLQQAVLDSVQRVWRSAEQVIDSFQGKDPLTEEQSFNIKISVPRKEDVVEYLSKLLDHIKKVDMPDHDVLVDYIGKMLDHVKHGVEDILNDVFTESVSASLNNVWENTEKFIQDFHSHEGDGEKAGHTAPDREHLLEYLSKVLTDICLKDDEMGGSDSAEVNNKEENIAPEIPEQKGQSDSSFTGPQLETPFGSSNHQEEEPIKHGFWSRRIGKMLKKTGKTVRKLGRKVAGTWGKIKAIWHEKKPTFFKMGNGLASTIKKASSKFARMCKKMSSRLFKTTESTEVNIDSKYVYKLRKHWQKMVMKDPCQLLGKFSYECNVGKKQCQRDLNKISDSFSHLLKIQNVKREQILKLSGDALKGYYKQFKSFRDQWWKSKLLLKTDKEWVDCQLSWWTAAIAASHGGNVDGLDDNKCNKINLSLNFYGQYGITFSPNINILAEDVEEKGHCTDNSGNVVSDGAYDVQNQPSRSSGSQEENNDDDVVVEDEDDDFEDDNNEKNEKEQTHKDGGEHKSYIPNIDEAELNETAQGASGWLQQAKVRLHLRREKEKARWMFEQAAGKNKERYNHWNEVKETDDKDKFGDWFFQKSKDREHQREEAGKSSWIFERAAHRRDAFHHKWMDNKKEGKHHKRGAKNSDDWFMKQAEERQKIREDEHKSDWVFERAADRQRNHGDKHGAKFRKHHQEREEHGKQFRHAYGKVSTP